MMRFTGASTWERTTEGRHGQLTAAKWRALKSPLSGHPGASDIYLLPEDR